MSPHTHTYTRTFQLSRIRNPIPQDTHIRHPSIHPPPTLSFQVLDLKTSKVLKTIWTSDPLGNYSWDRWHGYSPPILAHASDLDIPLSEDSPVLFALSVSNNGRNLQIPVDDLAKGFDIRVGFSKTEQSVSQPRRSDTQARVLSSSAPFVGLYPYHGDGVPFGAGQLWCKPQPLGALAVLLINYGGQAIKSFSVSLESTFNLTAASYRVRDVWAHADVGVAKGNLTLTVAPYDAAFVVLSPEK